MIPATQRLETLGRRETGLRVSDMRAAGPPPRGSSRLSSCTGRIDRERSHGLTRIRRRVRTVRRARVSGALPRARVESFSRAARRRSRNNTDPLEFGWSSPLGRRRDRRALSVPSPSTCARQSGNLGSASNTPCKARGDPVEDLSTLRENFRGRLHVGTDRFLVGSCCYNVPLHDLRSFISSICCLGSS